MKDSKPVPVWLLVIAIIALVVSVALRLGFKAIVEAFHPTSVIADMRLRDSLTYAMTATHLATAGLWIAVILTAAVRRSRR